MVGFEQWWGILLSMIVLVSSGILTIHALNDFFDFAIQEIRFLRMDPDQQKLVEFNRRLRSLIDYFKTAPAEAFQDFLTALKTEGLNVSEFNLFFEKLKTTNQGRELIQNIENEMKRIENLDSIQK
jgi:hypothetical protein